MNNTNNTMETLNQAIINLDFDLFESTWKGLNEEARDEIDNTHNFWKILSDVVDKENHPIPRPLSAIKFDKMVELFKFIIFNIYPLPPLAPKSQALNYNPGVVSSFGFERKKDIIYLLHTILKHKEHKMFGKLIDILSSHHSISAPIETFNDKSGKFSFIGQQTIFQGLLCFQENENCDYYLEPCFANLTKLFNPADQKNVENILSSYLRNSIHLELCIVKFLLEKCRDTGEFWNPLQSMLENPNYRDSNIQYEIAKYLIEQMEKGNWHSQFAKPFCTAYTKNFSGILKLLSKYTFDFVIKESNSGDYFVVCRMGIGILSFMQGIKNAVLKFFKHK